MSLIHYFDHHEKKIDKQHFLHLVQIAASDGMIDPSEMELLQRIGRRFGFTEPEVECMLASKETVIYTPPYELEKRFHQLYDLSMMMLADGTITDSELAHIRKLAISGGFKFEELDQLINLLVKGIKEGLDEEDLFTAYRKKRF